MEKITISVDELRQQLGISRTKAYALARSADFPAIKLGGRILIPLAQLEAWIARQAEKAGQEAT